MQLRAWAAFAIALALSGCGRDAGPPTAPDPAAGGPTITYREITSVTGQLPFGGQVWSPTGHVLLFNTDRSLFALDLDQLGAPPIQLAKTRSYDPAWSPDGKWILAVEFHGRSFAASVDGAHNVTLDGETEDLRAFFWGTNGNIYGAFVDSLRVIPPPDAWRRANPQPFPVRDQYVESSRSLPGQFYWQDWVMRVRTYPDGVETQWVAPPLLGASDVYIVENASYSPIALLWTRMDDGSPGHVAAVDPSGQTLLDFKQEATDAPRHRYLWPFAPSSVSPDGYLLIGTTERSNPIFIEESPLHVADVDGKWIVPVTPKIDGLGPVFASEGLMIAFEGLYDGTVHIGELTVTWPQ